jgi:hypothetical protein
VEIVQAGVTEALFESMREFPDRVEVQLRALKLLRVLEEDIQSRDVDYFGASQGLRRIVAGARLRPSAASAELDNTSGFIGLQILELLMTRRPEKIGTMLALGLVPLVLEVMARVKNTELYMLRTSCRILHRLVSKLRFRAAVVREDVEPQVRAAMRRLPENWELQRDACGVLARMQYPLGARRRSLVDPELIVLVLAAMHRNTNPHHTISQAAGLVAGTAALVAFMRSRRNIATVSDAGALLALVRVLRSQVCTRELALGAYAALVLLAGHGDNRTLLHDNNGVELALGHFKLHTGDPHVQQEVLVLLSRLLTKQAHIYPRFIDGDGPRLLTEDLNPDLDIKSQKVARRILQECAR